MNGTRTGDHAVVLGGSMAGLLAARVLADAYPRVTLVERDGLPPTPAARRGVPQGRHIHGLMARGQQILDELFPGFTDDLAARGVPVLDQLDDTRLHFGGHRLRRARSGLAVLSGSRPCIEGAVRTRVRALRGVTVVDRCEVRGLATTRGGGRVTGARVLRLDDAHTEEVLDADLVVDATGRGSRLPRWLSALGYRPPPEDRVTTDLAYATVTLRLRPDALGGDRAVIAPPAPGGTRGAGLAVIEGDRYILTLVRILGDRPPTTPEQFVDYAGSLHLPDVRDAVRDATMLDDPVAIRFPASVRRRYERLTRFPDGLLVTGDALCSVNPIYGQGMSVAALEACALRRHLNRGHEPHPRDVLREMARAVDVPWEMATGGDLAFPGVEGARGLRVRAAGAYVRRVQAAAAHDAEVAVAFLRVAGMVDPPAALLRPAIAGRVLLRARPTRGRPPIPSPGPVSAVGAAAAGTATGTPPGRHP